MWSPADYLFRLDSPVVGDVAGRVYQAVFRRDFTVPGFALVRVAFPVSSSRLRRLMVELKTALGGRFAGETGRGLAFTSAARFDQQVTTRFHLDGSPPEAILLLGYEPSAVPSELAIADYTRAAHEWGIQPADLLANSNPMFADHARRLIPYVTRVEGFDPAAAQLLVVNNGSLPYREGRTNLLGVMHQATIPRPMPDRLRVVNSTMIVPDDLGVPPLPADAVEAFCTTDRVAGEVMAGR